MSIFEQFPYTNFHDLNLDWILKHMKELVQSVQQITANLDGWDEEIKEHVQKVQESLREQLSWDSIISRIEAMVEEKK